MNAYNLMRIRQIRTAQRAFLPLDYLPLKNNSANVIVCISAAVAGADKAAAAAAAAAKEP